MSYKFKISESESSFKATKQDESYKVTQQESSYQVTEVTDRTAPVLQTAIIPANGLTIVLTYNETLDSSSVPATTDFVISGTASVISSVGVSSSVVTLTMNTAIFSDDTVTLDYTKGINPIQDDYANEAANLSSQAVTNNSEQSTIPAVLSDGNTVAWYDFEENVTADESNYVSIWGDKSGNNNDLEQSNGSYQPLLTATGILFDGVDNTMKKVFTLNQPEMIYIVFKQITWTLYDRIFDGGVDQNTGTLQQSSTSPDLRINAGGSVSGATMPLDTYGIARIVFNDDASKVQINESAAIEGDARDNNMAGFTIAGRPQIQSQSSNIEVKEIIIRKIVDEAKDEIDIYNYLSDKYSLETYPAVLDDGNTVAWYDYQQNITVDENNYVSIWGDRTDNDNDLLQDTGSNQPLLTADGILFDGVDNYMEREFTLSQPEMIYIVFKQVTWSANDIIFDGIGSLNRMIFQQFVSSPNLIIYAPSGGVQNSDLAVDTFGIARALFNSTSSELTINEGSTQTGNVGTNNANGFTLGSRYGGASYSNIQVKEIIIRSVADSAEDEQTIYDYLSDKYNI